MILQALTAYYEQLLKQGKVEAPGWDSRFKVSYELRLGPDGQLLALNDLRQEVPKGKKTVIAPRELPVPHRVKRASGVAANFLCDNTSYLLGADEKGKPERSRQCFEACAALHHKVLDGVDSPAAKAILTFFDSWEPDTAPAHPLLAEQWADLNNNANLVFGYESPNGAHWLATTDKDIRAAWQSAFDTSDADAETARCLITGKEAGIARIHPAIKGVMGAQAAGAALVSFNAPAFCSYGHEQGANAPVSEYAAFAYTTALNLLLADRNCCQRIGDTTIVCWAENAAPAYSNAMLMFFCGGAEAHGVSESDLAAALKALSQGRPVSFLDDKLDPNQNFYVLGISPNAARLSVRFFLRSSFGQFAKNLQNHADRLSITRPAFDKRESLSVWALAQETVNQRSRDKNPSPQLVGDLLRAILTGGPYPATLLNGVTLRIRAEREVTRGRAAILKAYYLRNYPTELNKEVFTVSLNESSHVPYVLGRLFSVLETIQSVANPGINATIKDRYFNSACATPATAFPTLVKLAQKHLQKMTTPNEVHFSKQLTELMAQLPETGFPARLSLPEQGAFEIGYYHQTQKRYAKKAAPDIDAKLRDYMCENYFDIRTFGAVMTTFVKGALNCGQVRGPVQLSFARSVDPIVPQEVTITRVAITTEADAEKKGTEMGRKHIVPYALYRAEGYVSANLARKTTGFSEDDLKLLWTAILNMFENDHSAARGKMAVRELIVFKHDSELGNAPAYKLFDSVTVRRKPDVDAARSYSDYTVTVADTLPEGVTCERLS